MGSHGGILTEGGMIPFAFWKDPPPPRPNQGKQHREGRPGGREAPAEAFVVHIQMRLAFTEQEWGGHPGV